VLRTLPYRAPELFPGHEPTAAVDLRALGVTLFGSLEGRLPFTGDDQAALMMPARPRAALMSPS
jgi:serine/threonine protein kinase